MQSYATYAKIVFSSKSLLKIIHIDKKSFVDKTVDFPGDRSFGKFYKQSFGECVQAFV